VSYISQVMTLLPGDVVLTGTPQGVGPMQIGDRVRVEIEGIGHLENTVVPRSSPVTL
jgi:2-keto-4-pentenoate hydratase/2-oxohepta-3-ene-1,7-dioic acid hydratase in catechol pathway